MLLLKSRFRSGGFCLSRGDWNDALELNRALGTERRVLQEQRVYDTQMLKVEKKEMNGL